MKNLFKRNCCDVVLENSRNGHCSAGGTNTVGTGHCS